MPDRARPDDAAGVCLLVPLLKPISVGDFVVPPLPDERLAASSEERAEGTT